MMMITAMQGHLLAAAMWYLCLCGMCTALSIRIDYSGYRKSVSINHIIRIAALRSRHPDTDDSMVCNSLHRFRSVDYLRLNDDAGTDIHKKTYTKNEGATAKLLHSIALATSCRRISFLIISIVLTNFVRYTILKASVP
jgi:hypothetical protein